jgi:putative tryptophan/tyrosine transport system substrate-binding protein
MRPMERREFIGFWAAAVAGCPLVAHAQQSNPPRIGFLRFSSAVASGDRVAALRARLRDLGYVEGRNIIIVFRFAERFGQLAEFAKELAENKVDVIFATGSTEVEAARKATGTIPIVFATHGDPINLGHVESLSSPGGNITGLTMLLTELVSKELEILKETVSNATRVGVLFSPNAPSHRPALAGLETAGAALGISLHPTPVAIIDDFDGAFATLVRERVDAVLAVSAPPISLERARLAELSVKHKLPTMFSGREYVEAGGLMSYGADIEDLTQRAATYIDKILKGAKPADLPVEQASKYRLVINLKTADALGLTIPPAILARADEVIE